MFGFFLDPDPFTSPLANRDRFFYRSLPTFLAFAFAPVTSLYEPVFSAFPPIPEVRLSLLNFLSLVFQPLQAELLLLWLVGRRRRENPLGGVMGLISLAFTKCHLGILPAVSEILNFLCTAVAIVPNSNSASLRPRHTYDEFNFSPLVVPNGTRIVVDESRVDAGSDDFLVLQRLISDQKVEATVGGPVYPLEASFPVLVLAGEGSEFQTSIEVEIGDVNVGIELPIEEEMITVFRYYVESVRYREWELGEEGEAFLRGQVMEAMATMRLSAEQLRVLMDLTELVSVSVGEDGVSADTWNHAVEIMMKTVEMNG
jgi:hypothetical protein